MDRGSYYNLNFVRGERSMVRNLRRTKIKGKKAHSQPEVEPDFYSSEWKKAAPSKVVVEQAPPSIPQVVNAVVSSAPVDNHVVSDDSDSSLSGEDLLSIFSDSFSADETPEEPKMSWGSDFAFVPNNVISSALLSRIHLLWHNNTNNQKFLFRMIFLPPFPLRKWLPCKWLMPPAISFPFNKSHGILSDGPFRSSMILSKCVYTQVPRF